ncbi:Uu.00g111750.m01.CDS01 [Anthostomella pinea]|uniref:Uu.00g111750.m01.CDS01 n=1 Tax=Anthostomella pinea TaxID=933095 RepID=A0AAI8YGI8_9PEZI|nr:Uu.00g111750.m01.CDS01 [Anthostomella pinea]
MAKQVWESTEPQGGYNWEEIEENEESTVRKIWTPNRLVRGGWDRNTTSLTRECAAFDDNYPHYWTDLLMVDSVDGQAAHFHRTLVGPVHRGARAHRAPRRRPQLHHGRAHTATYTRRARNLSANGCHEHEYEEDDSEDDEDDDADMCADEMVGPDWNGHPDAEWRWASLGFSMSICFSRLGPVNFRTKDIHGATALHYASGRQCGIIAVEALLKAGANYKAKDDHGVTPLMNACRDSTISSTHYARCTETSMVRSPDHSISTCLQPAHAHGRMRALISPPIPCLETKECDYSIEKGNNWLRHLREKYEHRGSALPLFKNYGCTSTDLRRQMTDYNRSLLARAWGGNADPEPLPARACRRRRAEHPTEWLLFINCPKNLPGNDPLRKLFQSPVARARVGFSLLDLKWGFFFEEGGEGDQLGDERLFVVVKGTCRGEWSDHDENNHANGKQNGNFTHEPYTLPTSGPAWGSLPAV